MPLFSVTPVLSRGSKKEWWCVSAPTRPRWRQPPRSGARREPGKEPATRLPTGYRPAFPGERWARVGCRQRAYGYPPAAGAGGAGLPAESVCLTGRKARARDASEKLDGWSVGDRGGGTSSPSPSAPPPVAISPRSSIRGESRERAGYGGPPAPPRTRLPTKYRHARTPPPGGGGGGAPQARAGRGLPAEAYA